MLNEVVFAASIFCYVSNEGSDCVELMISWEDEGFFSILFLQVDELLEDVEDAVFL